MTIVARITGRVQGVWYRGWTRTEAQKLGISGWVRNESDGSVTALLQGPASAVEVMTGLLRRGPPAAHVEELSTEPLETEQVHGSFTILR